MVRVFLETGKDCTSEYVFVQTLLKELGLNQRTKIECVGGKDKLKTVSNIMKDNILEGGKNIVLFDADSESNGGGFEKRRKELLASFKKYSIDAELFLFPNNHDDGCFENLLEHLILKEKNQKLLDCYNDYENCLGDDYIAPNLKGKLYTYISAQKNLSKSQRDKLGSGQWLFDDRNYWNLNDSYLDNLKEFLKSQIQ